MRALPFRFPPNATYDFPRRPRDWVKSTLQKANVPTENKPNTTTRSSKVSIFCFAANFECENEYSNATELRKKLSLAAEEGLPRISNDFRTGQVPVISHFVNRVSVKIEILVSLLEDRVIFHNRLFEKLVGARSTYRYANHHPFCHTLFNGPSAESLMPFSYCCCHGCLV